MSSDIFEVAEGILYQSSDEAWIYTITTTNVLGTPTSATVVVYDEGVDEDVTTTVMSGGNPGTPSGDVITLKLLSVLTKGHSYRVEVKFTKGSESGECWFAVKCIR